MELKKRWESLQICVYKYDSVVPSECIVERLIKLWHIRDIIIVISFLSTLEFLPSIKHGILIQSSQNLVNLKATQNFKN
jgi:hypothetical protein